LYTDVTASRARERELFSSAGICVRVGLEKQGLAWIQRVDWVIMTAPFAWFQQVCIKMQQAIWNDDGLMECSCLVNDALERLYYSGANPLQASGKFRYCGHAEMALWLYVLSAD